MRVEWEGVSRARREGFTRAAIELDIGQGKCSVSHLLIRNLRKPLCSWNERTSDGYLQPLHSKHLPICICGILESLLEGFQEDLHEPRHMGNVVRLDVTGIKVLAWHDDHSYLSPPVPNSFNIIMSLQHRDKFIILPTTFGQCVAGRTGRNCLTSPSITNLGFLTDHHNETEDFVLNNYTLLSSIFL